MKGLDSKIDCAERKEKEGRGKNKKSSYFVRKVRETRKNHRGNPTRDSLYSELYTLVHSVFY